MDPSAKTGTVREKLRIYLIFLCDRRRANAGNQSLNCESRYTDLPLLRRLSQVGRVVPDTAKRRIACQLLPRPEAADHPLQQTIVNELRGHGKRISTGESGLRTQAVLDACLRNCYDSE